jgi:hypothetical protein
VSYADELRWLKKWPEFEERPATIDEFLGDDYLGIEKGVRRSIRIALEDIMGDEVSGDYLTRYPLAMITGGIGIGKTTIASIVLPWMCHWVLCLKSPQEFLGLLPGSRIAFMQMSTSEQQAKEVVFGDIKARIQYSPWFREKYPYDPNFKNQIRFPKDVWIVPGDSGETTFEGYNILGGIIDEADSHKVVRGKDSTIKDYAEDGYNTIHGRVSSRFGRVKRPQGERNFGFLLIIGQMKKSTCFAARKYKEFSERPDAYATRMSIWESLGWERFLKEDGTRDSFVYDVKRKEIIPTGIGLELLRDPENRHLMEIPTAYQRDFENKPEKALKDLAGIPPEAGDPFISLTYKIEEAQERWHADRDGLPNPMGPRGDLASWFRATDSLRRVVHIDIAYSADGDALGLAMGHVRHVVDIDGEMKPHIVFDLLARWKAKSGTEIMLGDIRQFIYALRDDLGFKIEKVTYDGFQSTDSIQQLRKRRFISDRVSVDTDLLPYYDLRDALYENRIDFPKYMVYVNHGDDEQVDIVYRELSQLEDQGKKVDHPELGSKDIADAMAGVTLTLMGDRRYRKRVVSLESVRNQKEATGTEGRGSPFFHPALGSAIGGGGLKAPIPPSVRPLGRNS